MELSINGHKVVGSKTVKDGSSSVSVTGSWTTVGTWNNITPYNGCYLISVKATVPNVVMNIYANLTTGKNSTTVETMGGHFYRRSGVSTIIQYTWVVNGDIDNFYVYLAQDSGSSQTFTDVVATYIPIG